MTSAQDKNHLRSTLESSIVKRDYRMIQIYMIVDFAILLFILFLIQIQRLWPIKSSLNY